MRVSLAILASLVLASGTAAAQNSQNDGLTIRMVSSPQPGSVQVLAEAAAPHDAAIGATPKPNDFTVWLDQGAVPGLTVSRNGSRGKPLTTVILFDETGTYKNFEGKTAALPAIYEYGRDATTDELGLVVFATDSTAFPIRTKPADFMADLQSVGKRKVGLRTNLVVGLNDGIELAAKEGEPGLRELIMFTDAGDLAAISEDTWSGVIARAKEKGVRVSVVLPPADVQPKNVKADTWLAAIRNLKLLAGETAGVYIRSSSSAEIAKALRDARTAAKGWLVLEGKLCGMKRGDGVDVRVEYVPGAKRVAWSAGASLGATAFAPGSDAACPSLCAATCDPWQECIGGTCSGLSCTADVPCPGGAACVDGHCDKPCAQACAAWQECNGGACIAKMCSANETCGAGSLCKDGRCSAPRGAKSSMLIWILAGAGALLLAIALLVLLRKAPPPPPAVEAPAPFEPEPIIAAPHASPLDLDPLPETHLVAIGGWATLGERWRLHKRKTMAGASSDPGDGNDLVFAIKQISSKHAVFDLFPSGDLWVTDLGSSNGTYVNGKRLTAKERARLAVGDQIKLSQQLVLVVERPGVKADEPVPRAPEAAAPEAAAPAKAPAAKQKTRFDPENR